MPLIVALEARSSRRANCRNSQPNRKGRSARGGQHLRVSDSPTPEGSDVVVIANPLFPGLPLRLAVPLQEAMNKASKQGVNLNVHASTSNTARMEEESVCGTGLKASVTML